MGFFFDWFCEPETGVWMNIFLVASKAALFSSPKSDVILFHRWSTNNSFRKQLHLLVSPGVCLVRTTWIDCLDLLSFWRCPTQSDSIYRGFNSLWLRSYCGFNSKFCKRSKSNSLSFCLVNENACVEEQVRIGCVDFVFIVIDFSLFCDNTSPGKSIQYQITISEDDWWCSLIKVNNSLDHLYRWIKTWYFSLNKASFLGDTINFLQTIYWKEILCR